MRTERFGELRAHVTGGDDGHGGGNGPVVVLLHGFGAPGDDLVDLARYLRVPASVRFVFPEAPLALDDGYGRAWWMLDLSLFERRARGERIDRSEDVPAALPAVRAQLAGCLEAIQQRLSVSPERTILGGFSQGSMLACDAVLHAAHKPAGLILLSSTLIARSVWEPRLSSIAGLPILQTHGHHDPLLAYDDAVRLAELLRGAGAILNFIDFPGGHELPPPTLHAMGQFITQQLR